MPWVRYDDQFPINRKVSRLSDAAYRLHSSAIFWCARNLTDGAVPKEDLEDVCARVRTPERFVSELLGRGLWHAIGDQCDSEDCPAHTEHGQPDAEGWVIHDYLEFQPSKAQVLADRKSSAARQKRWREKHKQGDDDSNGVSNGVSNKGSNAAPSRPVPSSSPNGDEETNSTSPSRARTRDTGTRLPADFTVTQEMADWARENTPTCGTADHEAFCDYWRSVPGAKGRKLDWVGTWRNWMRREHASRATKPSPNGTARSTTDERMAQAQSLKEEFRTSPPPTIRGEIAR